MNLPVIEINVGVELRDKSSGVSQVLSVESVSLYLKLKSKQAMARNFFSFLYSGFCTKRICASAYLFIGSFLEQNVQVGKDQEKAQSNRNSHSKNRGGNKTKLTIKYN